MRKEFFLIIIITIIVFFSLDVILKKYFNYIQKKNNYVISNTSYHHTLKKNYVFNQKYQNQSVKIYTNSLGFKDIRVRDIKKKIENKRFIFIGDSHTEGVSVKFEDTFVGLIGKSLKKNNIEILNAGVQSYSPIIYWKKTKDLIENKKLSFDHLIVFLDISDLDDEQNYYELDKYKNVVFRKTRDQYGNLININNYEKFKLILRRHTFFTYTFLSLVKNLIKKYNNSHHPWEAYIDENYFKASWTSKNKDEYSKGLSLMIKYMDDLYKLCNEKNIKLTIAVYPLPYQIWHEDLNSVQVKAWENFSKERDIQFINIFPLFVKENISRKKKLEVLNQYFFKYDVHPNKSGHKLLSESFIKKFKY